MSRKQTETEVRDSILIKETEMVKIDEFSRRSEEISKDELMEKNEIEKVFITPFDIERKEKRDKLKNWLKRTLDEKEVKEA